MLNIDGELVKHDGVFKIECLHKAFAQFAPPSWDPPTAQEAAREQKRPPVIGEQQQQAGEAPSPNAL